MALAGRIDAIRGRSVTGKVGDLVNEQLVAIERALTAALIKSEIPECAPKYGVSFDLFSSMKSEYILARVLANLAVNGILWMVP